MFSIFTKHGVTILLKSLQDVAPWVTLFCQFVLECKLLSGDLSKILRDTSNK